MWSIANSQRMAGCLQVVEASSKHAVSRHTNFERTIGFLQVVEANFKRMEQAHQEMHMQSQQTRHTHEMLVTDKAYLSKQVGNEGLGQEPVGLCGCGVAAAARHVLLYSGGTDAGGWVGLRVPVVE